MEDIRGRGGKDERWARPFTQGGGFAPAPPDQTRRATKRPYRTLSPKQVSLNFYEWASGPPASAPLIEGNVSPGRRSRGGEGTPPIPHADIPTTPLNAKDMGNSFLKPSGHGDRSPRPLTASVRSTSLSHRLQAHISPFPTVIAAAGDAKREIIGSQESLLYKAAHQDARKPSQPMSERGEQRRSAHLPSSQTRYSSQNNTLLSLGSTQITQMTVKEALAFLLSCGEEAFLHVTPRDHFYDLVVLELPGQSTLSLRSGENRKEVMERVRERRNGDRRKGRSSVFQLSLHGLLVPPVEVDDDEDSAELIPIPTLLKEMQQFDILQSKPFFRHFRALKIFRAWAGAARREAVSQARTKLAKSTFFSDSELVEARWKVGKATYAIETEIELFCFPSRSGLVNLQDYINLQLAYLDDVREELSERILELSEAMHSYYRSFLGSQRLQEQEQEVRRHHPLRGEMPLVTMTNEKTEESIDWVRLRSVQRLREDFRQKLVKVLQMAQLALEVSVSRLLEIFWLRLKQFLIGLHNLPRKKTADDSVVFWPLNELLFQSSGSLRSTAFNANELLASATGPNRGSGKNAGIVTEEQANSLHDLQKDMEQEDEKVENEEDQSEQLLISRDRSVFAKVTKEWESQGSHLSIAVFLTVGGRHAEAKDFIGLGGLDCLSVALSPSKSTLIQQVHNLCGALGRIIDSLPDLRKHELIYDPQQDLLNTTVRLESNHNIDLGLGELQNAQSSNYFTVLVMRPIYNSRFAYQLAVDFIRLIHQAYQEASDIEAFISRLFETLRKLCGVSPLMLAKQIERSACLPKLRTFIDHPDSLEDLKRAQTRDKSRLVAFRAAAAYLEKLQAQLDNFLNLKHRIGLVTNFGPLLEQIGIYRAIQEYVLFQRLPTAYNTRCTILHDFVRKLESIFDSQNKSTMELMELMRKLKYFDQMKEFLDGEVEFCEAVYQIISACEQRRQLADISMREVMIENLLSSRGHQAHASAIHPEKMHRVLNEALERMTIAIAKLRSYLFTQLVDLKDAVLISRHKLQLRISSMTSDIRELRAAEEGPDESLQSVGEEEKNVITRQGNEVAKLRKQVEENVDAQQLLVEAHDIVGAANMVLLPNQVESFLSMEQLEKDYDAKCRAWMTLESVNSLVDILNASRLGSLSLPDLHVRYVSLNDAMNYLRDNLSDLDLVSKLDRCIKEIIPKVRLVASLSSKVLRPHHWVYLRQKVLLQSGVDVKLSGKNSEFVSLLDVSGREPVGLGHVSRVYSRDLFSRNVWKNLDMVEYIVSEAVIESFLEKTLDSVEEALRIASVQSSGEWLRDQRLHDKVGVEVNEIVNLFPLRLLSRYCWKALLIVEATAQDMGLSTFDTRLFKSKSLALRIDSFIQGYMEVQLWWIHLLPFVKLLPRGEIDRDSIRSYNNCTEDMKKMENLLQQKSGNLFSAFISAADSDLNTDSIRTSLSAVSDDVHSCLQSMLEGCPRLTLLSYTRLLSLLRVWLLGPQSELSFVSSCMEGMFEGVGRLTVVLLSSQKIYGCTGFISSHKVDKVVFAEPIPFTLSLDEFVLKFSDSLRLVIEKACDLLMVHRINCTKALLSDGNADLVLKNMPSFFHLRCDHLQSSISNEVINSAFLLSNSISFAEDLWTCLGHPTGSIIMARPDLIIENVAFASRWKEHLAEFINCCEQNLSRLQFLVGTCMPLTRTSLAKSRSILSGLAVQEVYHMQIARNLLDCDCLESALELWMTHYQLRFQYAKEQRYNHCPIDIVVGNIALCYGMEYQESGCAWLPKRELDFVLSRVLSASFCWHGTTLVHASENIKMAGGGNEEYGISAADIARALGRLSVTLTQASHMPSVRYFFAKVILLDAIGCLDFTMIRQDGMQNVVQAAQYFWSMLDSRSDQAVQDALHFPLRARFTRNETHSERRKAALKSFRNDIFMKQKLNMHVHFILVGFATETEFSTGWEGDQLYRSIFDVVTVPFASACHHLGLLLASAGFLYGLDIQATFLQSLQGIFSPTTDSGDSSKGHRQRVQCIQEIIKQTSLESLIKDCQISLALYARRPSLVEERKSEIVKEGQLNNVCRYQDEISCFVGNIWHRILALVCYDTDVLKSLREQFLGPFLKKLDCVALAEELRVFRECADNDQLHIREPISRAIVQAAYSVGLVCKHKFVHTAALFLNLIQSTNSPVVILHGEAASGKTALWKIAIEALNNVPSHELKKIEFSSIAKPVMLRIAAQKIGFFLKRNILMKKRDKSNHDKDISAQLPVENHNIPSSTKKEKIESARANVAIIFHASISSSALLGGYDQAGRWMDGLLVRSLRRFVDRDHSEEERRSSSLKGLSHLETIESKYFIILDGPMNLFIEELLHSIYFQTPRVVVSAAVAGFNVQQRGIMLPTNELLVVPPSTKILVETDDISQASPNCLSLIPLMNFSATSAECINRIITVWTRSVTHWLGDFAPWLDFMDEMNKLLLETNFVEDMLYEHLSSGETPALALLNSQLGSFLRLLEELLLQVQESVLPFASFVATDRESASDSDEENDTKALPNDKHSSLWAESTEIDKGESRSSMGVEWRPSLSKSIKFAGTMSLSPRVREILLRRARLSVVYAAIWGFGGALNSSEKRKFFDSIIRDTVQHYMDPDVVIPSDCLVFELYFDVDNAELVPALEYGKGGRQILQNSCLTAKQLEQNIFCEFIDNSSGPGTLVFRSMSSRAVSSVLRLLVTAGANVLLFGQKGSGKTHLIQGTLEYFRQETPSPSDLRRQIIEKLLDILCGATVPQGIFRALEIIRTILFKSANIQLREKDDQNDFNTLWRAINSDLETFAHGSARANCVARAVSSASTSLCVHESVRGVRSWLEREFATEVNGILETARFSYGVAFIDDVHVLSLRSECINDPGRSSLVADRIDELLRGLLYGHPCFGIRANPTVRSPLTLGHHRGSNDGGFLASNQALPLLHRETFTDIRVQQSLRDNYLLQQLGLISAASGQYNDHRNKSWLNHIASHFAMLSLPSLTVAELHVALVSGAFVMMSTVVEDLSLLSLLQSEVSDLSRITLNLGLKTISSVDLQLTTTLERTLRVMILLDIGAVSRFSLSLRYGSVHIKNPGGLLQLYAHEWKRYFLDPLPLGAQRDRLLGLMHEHLDNLDEKVWAVSHDWIKEIKEELSSTNDKLWMNSLIFEPEVTETNGVAQEGDNNRELLAKTWMSLYLPVSLNVAPIKKWLQSGEWCAQSLDYKEIIPANEISSFCNAQTLEINLAGYLSDSEARALLYPSALSLLLRLVRVLSVQKRHLVVAGYPGCSKRSALMLAARICRLEAMVFAAKPSQSVADTRSEIASPAFKFKQSLKAAVLRATGFSDPVRADDIEQGRRPDLGSIPLFPEQVYYSICPSQNIVYVVNEAQQLSEIERRYLLHIVDFVDPTVLFEDAELLGMIDALRREAKSTREREVQVKHEHIQSQQDTGPAATALHANIPNAMSNPSMEALSAARSVDAADLKEGLVENLGENTALVSTGGGATEDISKESFDESTTDVKDESLPVTSQKVVTSSALKSKQGLTGYSFHWIKSHLRSSLQGNFCVILNLSLAAVVEISPAMYYSGQDCSILLRKSVGQSHAKSSNKANGEKAAPIQKLSVSGGIDAKHIGLQSPSPSGSSPGFYQPTMGRRFSMRTARSSDQGMDKPQVLFNPAASLTTVGNRSDAAIDESGVETSNGVNGGSVGGLGGVVGNNSNLGVPLAQSIFTCPILGPILNRKFNLIWYEIGSNEAVNGLATVFMRNKQAIHSGRSLDNVLLLPLRTLPVGSYHTSALSETLPDTNTSRRLTAVEKEAQEKDEQRRVKFTSSSTESRSIHLHLITTNGPNHCSLSCWQHEKISSIVHLFGVFRSFETEYLRSEMANLEAEKALPLFLDEAKVLLPSLLTLSLPSDGLFLKEHAYTESMESISQRAMQTVMWILSYQGRELLKSKCVLEHVLVGLQESCSILEHDEDMNQRLAENNEELAKIVRELSKEVDDTRKNLENLHISFQKSSNYEIELMLKEEISCMSWHIDSFIQNVENQVLQRKNQLRSFSASDWHVLSKSYNGKITPKAYIEMMRALMVVINYSPPKILKGDKSGAGNVKMDDEVVAKCALTLLIKPHDFVNQLCAVQATNLSSAQSNALRVMNSLLNSQFVPYFDTEFCSPEKRFEMQETLAGPNPDEQPTADCLRRFLLSLDLHIVANQCVRERRPHVEVLEMELISLRKANADAQASQSNELKAKLEHLMGKMTSIEGSMLSNRKKIDIMEKNRTRKPVIMKGLTQFRLFIEEEVDHLYKILRNLVGDLCLIVAVLYRSGWLPDSQRQDCADMMRRHMRFHKIACTETPILAGSIFDRLQFRSFCSFSEVSASYDIPSMNCLSLLYLSPAHTLVVDPDNVALTAIIDAAPNGFETYSLPAQRFSLPVFDTWRRNALDNKSRDASIYLVIYDVHAGVSDDLITLLSAELDETYGFDSDNCLEADKMCPRLIINVGCLVGERSLAPHILIPPRFRVVLISNRSAVLDGNGRSSPLPLACLQQLTILHWTCSASPLIVEVNPLNAACEKHTATSNSFAYRLAHKLLAIQAGSGQSLPFKLQALSQQIVLTCRSLLDMEREIIGVVYHWLEGDILSSEKVFHIEGLVDQETVSLSILSSEQVVETLCKAIVRRESLKEEIMRARLLWREGVVYLSCVMNLFSMSADFLRLCGLLLPTADLFAPYSLSPASLATHLLSMFFNNSNGVKALIKKVPSSLLGALKVWNGIVALQRCLRSAKKADKTIPLVTGIREKSVDSPSTDDQQGMRKETERFVLSDQARKVAEEGNRSVGLSPTLRQKASHVLHFLLNPLKQPFLRDLSRYAELTIRPGCEHLVKYLLLVCSWAQDNSTVPLDEVRALTYLLLDSLRIPDRRFVHLLPIKRGIEDTSFSTKRLSSAYLISSGDNLTQRLRRCSTANAGQAPFQHGPASEDLKPNTQDKNDVVTSQEEEEEEEGFPQPLSILKRVTAFRTLAVSAPVLQKPKVEDRGIKWSTGQLLERGYGIPDGLFFNRRCFDWTIVYSCCSHSPHDLICSLVADQIDDVKLCSRLTRGPVTYGDPFEIDWLKLHGIRAFHTNNALALAALGASQRSTEEIAQARRPTVVSVVAQKNKLSSLPKQRKQTLLPKLQNHQRSERNELKREQQEEPTHQLNARRLTTRVSPLLQDMLQQTNNRILLTSRKTPSGKEKMLSKGTISSFHPSTNQVEDIFDVVQNSEAFQRLILIESHSSLAPIFKGLAGQLLRCRADLLSWKERLLDMAQAELSKTRADQVLECLMAGRPPLCFDIEESSSGGAFSRGAELSVLQSMLLAEALWPGSATTLLQLAFLVLRDYLKMGGHLHEYNKEDEDKDFENEHDDDDADDDSDENDMEMNSSSLTTKRTEDQSSEEEEEDDDRFEAPFSLGEQRENLERRGQNLGDLLLAPSNCWAKLERGLCTTTPFFREGIRDWEGVVMEVAAECLEVDKFVFMKELRDSICGSTTTYFLAPIFSGSDNSSQPQLSIFTQRARELALLTGRHLPVVFCDIISADRGSCYSNCLLDSSVVGNVYSGPSSEEAASKLVQQQMVEVIKNLRGSLSTARKALVERLSLSSSAASALFYSSILPSATMTKVMVEGSSVGSSTNVKIGGTSSGSEEGKRWAEGIPFIVSSSWGMNSRGPLGIFPPVALSELSFAWLPRFFAPDVVTLRTSASSSSSNSGLGNWPDISLPESCGILFEELETNLLRWLNASKAIRRTRLTSEIRQRLNRTNKLQTRMLAALVTIYQLHCYLRADALEKRGLRGVWSSCLNQLELWQLSRLTLKLSDLLSAEWMGKDGSLKVTRRDLLGQLTFRRAIKVLVESFSRPGQDFYRMSFTSLVDMGGSTGKRRLLSAMALTTVSGNTGQGISTNEINNRQDNRGWRALMGQLKGGDKESLGLKGQTGSSSRAKKQWKKMMRKVEEGRQQFVRGLSNDLMLRASCASGTLSDSVFAEASVLQVTQEINSEMQRRFIAMVEHFVAEIIAIMSQHRVEAQEEAEAQGQDALPTERRRASSAIEAAAMYIINARKQSTKMNINSIITGTTPSQNVNILSQGNLKIADPEVAFGALPPEDVLQCLVKWTLDGSRSGQGGNERIGGIDRMKILRSIKRLSAFVKQQAQHEPTK